MGKYSLKMNILHREREKNGIVIIVKQNRSMVQNDIDQWVQSSCCSLPKSVIILSLLLLMKLLLSLVLISIFLIITPVDDGITVIMILVNDDNDYDGVHYEGYDEEEHYNNDGVSLPSLPRAYDN